MNDVITPELCRALAVGGHVQVETHYIVECLDANGERKWVEDFHNLVVTAGLNFLLESSFRTIPGSVAWFVGLIGAGTGTVAITSGLAAVTGTTTAFASADSTLTSDMIIVGAGASGADLNQKVSSFASTTSIGLNGNAGTTVSGANYAIEPRDTDTMASKSFNETAPYSNATRPAWTANGAAAAGAISNSSAKASFTINATGRVFGAFLASNSTVSGSTGTLYGGGLFSVSRSVLSGDTLNVQADLSITATL